MTNMRNYQIPNLPIGPIVDKDGNLSDVGKTFFSAFIRWAQINFGNEGLVAPTQTASNITTIQNNTQVISAPGGPMTVYTCQYGTMLYDSTDNSGRFCINNGSGVPIFKTITLS